MNISVNHLFWSLPTPAIFNLSHLANQQVSVLWHIIVGSTQTLSRRKFVFSNLACSGMYSRTGTLTEALRLQARRTRAGKKWLLSIKSFPNLPTHSNSPRQLRSSFRDSQQQHSPAPPNLNHHGNGQAHPQVGQQLVQYPINLVSRRHIKTNLLSQLHSTLHKYPQHGKTGPHRVLVRTPTTITTIPTITGLTTTQTSTTQALHLLKITGLVTRLKSITAGPRPSHDLHPPLHQLAGAAAPISLYSPSSKL